jgi:hypothetical protein
VWSGPRVAVSICLIARDRSRHAREALRPGWTTASNLSSTHRARPTLRRQKRTRCDGAHERGPGHDFTKAHWLLDENLARLLITHDANSRAYAQGHTPISLAEDRGHTNIVRSLTWTTPPQARSGVDITSADVPFGSAKSAVDAEASSLWSPAWSCSAAWLARRPVKAEAAGSSPVRTASRAPRAGHRGHRQAKPA